MRPESNQREEATQRRGGAHNREVEPLPLGFDAEMGTGFLKGDVQLPPRDEPLKEIDGAASRSVQRKACGGSSPRGSRTSNHTYYWPVAKFACVILLRFLLTLSNTITTC